MSGKQSALATHVMRPCGRKAHMRRSPKAARHHPPQAAAAAAEPWPACCHRRRRRWGWPLRATSDAWRVRPLPDRPRRRCRLPVLVARAPQTLLAGGRAPNGSSMFMGACTKQRRQRLSRINECLDRLLLLYKPTLTPRPAAPHSYPAKELASRLMYPCICPAERWTGPSSNSPAAATQFPTLLLQVLHSQPYDSRSFVISSSSLYSGTLPQHGSSSSNSSK